MTGIDDIINSIKQIPGDDVIIYFSYGRKSALLAWCALKAGKRITLRFIIDESRVFEDIKEEMKAVVKRWELLGAAYEEIRINCPITEYVRGKQCIQLPCIAKQMEITETKKERNVLSTQPRFVSSWWQKVPTFYYPFEDYDIREITNLSKEIPHGLILDLQRFDCPHYCANPICPYWEKTHPESLLQYKGWTCQP